MVWGQKVCRAKTFSSGDGELLMAVVVWNPTVVKYVADAC
jgi:hypothetical protein